MNIKKKELGLTSAAKRSLLRLEGVETLQDLVDNYSEQELFEDHGFKKHSVTYASIVECLNMYELHLYPTFYERKKALRQLPSVVDPEKILLTELELPEFLLEKLSHWEKFRTLGDLSSKLKEYGLKHDPPEYFGLYEFKEKVRVRVEPTEELVEVLRNNHTHDKVDFNGYPHYKLYEHTRFEEVERSDSWMGFVGAKRKVMEPTGFVYNYYKDVRLTWSEKKLLIRTLALHGLYPEHARVRPTLM